MNQSTSCQRKPPLRRESPWKQLYCGHSPNPFGTPRAACLAHVTGVTGTQVIRIVCGTREAATELKLTGHSVGIYTDVGPQKLQTIGLQNKMCWKPQK